MKPHAPTIRHARRLSSTPSPEEQAVLRRSLSQPLPELLPKYFYDDVGSQLFERITTLPAYYQTRTEIQILQRHAAALMSAARPRHLMELGSGAGHKIRLLLNSFEQGERCTMLDINELFLRESLQLLSADYPRYTFDGLVGDFVDDLDQVSPSGPRMTVLFAGTIGNLHPAERHAFLEKLALGMSSEDSFLVGVDLIKDHGLLEAAYNDPEGVTAAFNRNMLAALNHRFGSNFVLPQYQHRAFYDPENAWIEMRLISLQDQSVDIPGLQLQLTLPRGAELRTEVSCKFSRESLEQAAQQAGLRIEHFVTDPQALFGIALIRKGRTA
ncbi:MAG TPA: L-histidine N(alpha)-methyltransferase [Pseudomonadota bacterium]|nr:L-histidine N(alpha)-methyltransferase [Pseudomonadota bacterium]